LSIRPIFAQITACESGSVWRVARHPLEDIATYWTRTRRSPEGLPKKNIWREMVWDFFTGRMPILSANQHRVRH